MPEGLRRCQQIPHELRRHPVIGRLSWSDYGIYVELRGIADQAHPSAGLLPRAIPDEALVGLLAADAIVLEDEQHFRCPELDQDRAAVSAFFRVARLRVKGERGPDGRFTKGPGQPTKPHGAATKPHGAATKPHGADTIDRTGRDWTPVLRPGSVRDGPGGSTPSPPNGEMSAEQSARLVQDLERQAQTLRERRGKT